MNLGNVVFFSVMSLCVGVALWGLTMFFVIKSEEEQQIRTCVDAGGIPAGSYPRLVCLDPAATIPPK